jgi:uncharacterized protein YmfQ (DUF2313 family)
MATFSPELSAAWTDELRARALELVEVAAKVHRESGRAQAYFLRTAIAHGVDVDLVAAAAHLTRDEVLALTDPAAG